MGTTLSPPYRPSPSSNDHFITKLYLRLSKATTPAHLSRFLSSRPCQHNVIEYLHHSNCAWRDPAPGSRLRNLYHPRSYRRSPFWNLSGPISNLTPKQSPNHSLLGAPRLSTLQLAGLVLPESRYVQPVHTENIHPGLRRKPSLNVSRCPLGSAVTSVRYDQSDQINSVLCT